MDQTKTKNNELLLNLMHNSLNELLETQRQMKQDLKKMVRYHPENPHFKQLEEDVEMWKKLSRDKEKWMVACYKLYNQIQLTDEEKTMIEREPFVDRR